MRKDSIAIGGVSLVLTAAIVGGGWYMSNHQSRLPANPEPASQSVAQPPVGSASSMPDVSAETSRSRSHRILECHDPELGKFYTNAASCEQADIGNRLSIADSYAAAPKPHASESHQALAQQAKRTQQTTKPRKPSLQLAGKSPPGGLNQVCTFAVGKALEIERVLAATDDPTESKWREDYCRWRCEAIEEDCGVTDSYYYYRYRTLCPQVNLNGC